MGHVLQNVGAPSAEAQERESTRKDIFRFAGREATASGIEKSFEERERVQKVSEWPQEVARRDCV